MAEFALASLLYHWHWLQEKLPSGQRLFGNPLLLNTLKRVELQPLVICMMGGTPEAQREKRTATGIPPHVMIMATVKQRDRELFAGLSQLTDVVQSIDSGLEPRVEALVRKLLD